jgi:hypothetical protein
MTLAVRELEQRPQAPDYTAQLGTTFIGSFPTEAQAQRARDRATIEEICQIIALHLTGCPPTAPTATPQASFPVSNEALLRAYTTLRRVITSTEIRKRLTSGLLIATERRYVTNANGTIHYYRNDQAPYEVTNYSCSCPDSKHRDEHIVGLCKHTLATYLVLIAQLLESTPCKGQRRQPGVGLIILEAAKARALFAACHYLLEAYPSVRLCAQENTFTAVLTPSEEIHVVKGEKLSSSNQELVDASGPLGLLITDETFRSSWPELIAALKDRTTTHVEVWRDRTGKALTIVAGDHAISLHGIPTPIR